MWIKSFAWSSRKLVMRIFTLPSLQKYLQIAGLQKFKDQERRWFRSPFGFPGKFGSSKKIMVQRQRTGLGFFDG